MANKKLSDEKSQVSLRGQELEVIKLKKILSFWQNRYTVRGDTLICQVGSTGVGHFACMQLLVESGANIMDRRPDGTTTALAAAAENGNFI